MKFLKTLSRIRAQPGKILLEVFYAGLVRLRIRRPLPAGKG
jgi:hypothetical protein